MPYPSVCVCLHTTIMPPNGLLYFHKTKTVTRKLGNIRTMKKNFMRKKWSVTIQESFTIHLHASWFYSPYEFLTSQFSEDCFGRISFHNTNFLGLNSLPICIYLWLLFVYKRTIPKWIIVVLGKERKRDNKDDCILDDLREKDLREEKSVEEAHKKLRTHTL